MATIDVYKKQYEAAKAKGDKAGMEAAHKAADQIRGVQTTTQVVNGQYTQVPNKPTPPKDNEPGGGFGGWDMQSDNTDTAGNRPTGPEITTNDSYRGGYITIDTGADYQQKINDAVAKGDYAAAAAAEAQRNAKINYLKSMGTLKGNASITSNWLDYSEHKNNQGGDIYNAANNGLGGMPSNWTTANLGGTIYSRKDGGIYQGGMMIGNEVNPDTGELKFTNQNDANRYAAAQAMHSGGLGNYGNKTNKSTEALLQDIINGGLISDGYMEAVGSGNVGKWTAETRANAPKLDLPTIKNEGAPAYVPPEEIPYPEAELVNDNSFDFSPVANAERYQDSLRRGNNFKLW